MTVKVPNFKEPGLSDFLRRQVEERDRLLSLKLDRFTANHSIFLISPSEKVWEITISDAGTLTATLVVVGV